jgi:hypothetical protein
MTSNVSDILTDQLIYVGAYAQGQTPNTDDLALALRVTNRKLDSLGAEKLSMVGLNRGSYTLTGAASYAYGPGMTWAPTSRPVKIKSASTLAANGTEHIARIATANQWAEVADKSRTGIFVEDLFWDNGYPTGHVYVSPMPAGGNCILWEYQQIPILPAVTGTVDLAPGYSETLVCIAAVDLCIAFQRPVTQELMAAQAQAKSVIVQLNAELYNGPMPPPAGPGPTSPPAVQTV